MLTLERAMAEYFKLSQPDFAENNKDILPIFTAAAVALATKMWIKRVDVMPGTFYIALLGEPGTGKTSFFRKYLRLFRHTEIEEINIGSPEAMLKDIKYIKHGYIWYDEVSHLAKLADSYMGTLFPLLNKAYYLDGLSQTRTDNKKSVVIEPESYFIHVYFGGVPADWAMIEKKAVGGFVRRTLVLYVKGEIPYFNEDALPPDEERRRAKLYNLINAVFKALQHIEIMIRISGLSALAEKLQREQIDREKKRMIEEYMYKVLAGRIVANIITFDVDEDPKLLTVKELVDRMKQNAERYGIYFEVGVATADKVDVFISYELHDDDDYNEKKDMKITDFVGVNFAALTYQQLINSIRPLVGAPDQITMRNMEKIQQWLESGGKLIVSKREFLRKILHIGDPRNYLPVLQLLEDAGVIKIVDFIYRGRNVQYVVLDTKARICANCAHYRNPQECPLLEGVFDFKEAAAKVPPWRAACEKFEGVDENEDN